MKDGKWASRWMAKWLSRSRPHLAFAPTLRTCDRKETVSLKTLIENVNSSRFVEDQLADVDSQSQSQRLTDLILKAKAAIESNRFRIACSMFRIT